ncbi:MAG TPA: hypothetical protein VEK08_20180 [Planctomycetota bacterium]|nr:hypothetical protein [Planctomycetota bacterium]
MRHAISAVHILLLLCGAVFAGEDTPPEKVLVRERTVYVPYEKLKETFEKEGRGVFLPYEEFLKLWNAGQPREKPPEDMKPPAEAVISGGSYTGVAKETAVRFEVTYKVKALGKSWSELFLPLKNVAVETASVSDPQAVFAPKGDGYALILPKPGEYTLTLAFSVRVDSKPGQRRIEFGIPPTAVSRLEMSIPEKDLRVEVTPKMAATVATPEGDATKLLAFIGNAEQVAVTWMPPVSKVEKGEAIVIASQAMHVELGERILRLDTAIHYKIERNEEDSFRIKLPANMRLLSVKGNNVREWSTENGILLVRLHSPAKDSYGLALRFERVLETTPEKLEIPFPAVVGALREDGFVTLAHEAGLRLRVDSSAGFSQIDPRELPDALKRNNLLAGFRYLAHPLTLALKIESVQPQIQSSVSAVTSLGTDDDGMNGWIDYQISKVGVFTLKLKFESRWDVASVGDAQTVEDFQVATEGAYKTLTVNLKNKALGNFRLPFKLSGPSRASAGELPLEPIQVLGTQQDRGLLGISAPKAFKLTTLERNKMVSANVQVLFATGLLSQLPPDFELPLAYSYTQVPASVKIALERRKTEMRVTGYHTIIVSEAGLDLTHKLDYFIEFAGVDKLSFSLPSALDDKLFDVKVPGLKEKKKVSEDKEKGRSTWDILLQEKVLGSIAVLITHKENLKGLEPEKPYELVIPDIRAEDVATQQGYVAIRKETALEIKPNVTNLEPLEGVNLPAEMRSSNVYLAFRYVQPARTMALQLTRHIAVDVTSTIVDLMRTTFVVSEEKKLAVRTDLWVENAKGEQYLELGLPANASIRALAVNGVSVSPLQKKGGGTLVKLASAAAPFPVQIIYAVPLESGDSKLGLMGGLDVKALEVLGGVPVNKIEAELFVPEDYVYFNLGGTLHRRVQADTLSNTLAWIDGVVRSHREPVQIDPGAGRFPNSPPILGSFTTQGRVFRLQTLAPQGQVTLNYCDRKLFWLFDALIFAGALAVGWTLISRKKAPALWICIASVVVPLCIEWLVTSDAGELFAAWLLAGVLLSGACAATRLRNGWNQWRESRLALAPDPYLEDAEEDRTEPAASKNENTEPGEQPPASAEKRDEGPVLLDGQEPVETSEKDSGEAKGGEK